MGLDKEKTERRWYWVRGESGQGRGIVVVAAWMLSKRRNLVPYTQMYAASGWDSLVCHPHVLNLWFTNRAIELALQILDELAKEVNEKPQPIVFATFSGGAKACLYKLFQILQGATEIRALPIVCLEKYATVRACVAGQIHDSSPVDFVSALGARFVTKEYQNSGIPKEVLLLASEVGAKILDALFLPHFELQRAEYWSTLHQSAGLGPILILCSTNDDLAPFHIINNFAKTMETLGSQVTFVVWDTSVHVGHFRRFPEEYLSAVTQFLEDARRLQNFSGFQSLPKREFMGNNSSENTSLLQPAYPSQGNSSHDIEEDNGVHPFQGLSAINSDTDSQLELRQNRATTYDINTVRVTNLPSFTSKL